MKPIPISAESKKTILIFALFLLLQTCLLTFLCSGKQGFHMDEYFTFCLANNETGAVNPTEIGKIYDKSYFTNYLAVEKGQEFSYRQVWVNQKNDVHPPLYYVFIHTLSSLFPGKFLPWLGLGFNIVLSLFITVCLYFLVKNILGDSQAALILAFGTALLAGMAECVLFIRMYELAMAFVLAISLLHVKYYKSTDKYFYIILYFISIAGALTHYYVIVYMFFLGIYYALHLLCQKRIKPFLAYICTMAFAGLTSLMIFPYSIRHLFSTNRGMESIANMQNANDFTQRLKIFGGFINHGLFAGCFWGLLLFALFCLWFRIKNKNPRPWPLELSMLAFSCVCFFLFVAKSASYREERYLFMVYPLVFLVVILSILILFPWSGKQAVTSLLLILLMISGTYGNFDFPLKYKEEAHLQSEIMHYRESLGIVVSDLGNYYRIVPSFGQLSSFKHVVFLQVDSLDSLEEYGLTDIKDAVIYVQNDFSRPKDVCKTIVRENPGLKEYKKLFSSEYMEVYHAW